MRSVRPAIFFLYLFATTYIVLLSPHRSGANIHQHTFRLIPFSNMVHAYHSLRDHSRALRIRYVIINCVGNILLFIPFAPLFPRSSANSDWRLIALTGILISILVETLQYCLHVGIADIDDLMLNTTGVLTGLYLCRSHTRRIQAS